MAASSHDSQQQGYAAMQRPQGAAAGAPVGGYNYPPAYPMMTAPEQPSDAQQISNPQSASAMPAADLSGYSASYAYGNPAVQQQGYADYMQQYYQSMPPAAPPPASTAGVNVVPQQQQYYADQRQQQQQQPPPGAYYPPPPPPSVPQDNKQSAGSMPPAYQDPMAAMYNAYGGGAAINQPVAAGDQYRQYYQQYQQPPPMVGMAPSVPPPNVPPMMSGPPPPIAGGSHGMHGAAGGPGRNPHQRRSRWDSNSGGDDRNARDRSYSPGPGPGKRDEQYHQKDDSRVMKTAETGVEMNNSVFIQGVPDMADNQIVAEYFSQVGEIMADNRGGPKVHVYKDKISGRPKGEAVLSYLNTQSAAAAIARFNGQYFPGCEVPMTVTFATSRASDSGRDGGGGGGYRRGGGGSGRYDNGGRGGGGGSRFQRGGYDAGGRGGFGRGRPPMGGGDRGGGGSFRGRLTGANMEGRSGDWVCTQCNNTNFGFRTQCNKCRAAKAEVAAEQGGGGYMGGGRGGPPGGDNFRGREYGDWSMGGGGPPGGGGFSRGGPPRGRGDYGGGPPRGHGADYGSGPLRSGPTRDRPRPY